MYDPYIDRRIEGEQPYPDSYWAQGAKLSNYPSLPQTTETDFLIIGGGYTGLSCAYHLGQLGASDITVLEANDIGWGCSGRNAGFVLPGTGRLSAAQLKQKWGLGKAQEIYTEYQRAITLTEQLLASCEQKVSIKGGYLRLAHTDKLAANYQDLAGALQQEFGEQCQFVKPHQLEDYLPSAGFKGGLYYPHYFGINPLALAQHLGNLCQQAQVQLYSNSPAIKIEKQGNQHLVTTAKGQIRAKTLLLATNAYSPKGFHHQLAGRTFPVQSSILVTQPLSGQDMQMAPFKSGLMVMDSRPMKYYYRLLPDNRILFGGRGAITAKNANLPRHKEALLEALKATLPAYQVLKAEHFWSGWVNIAYDDYPRIWMDTSDNVGYAGGYCGSGVSFSLQAGKRLAQLAVGENSLPDLPFWQSPLPKFPLSPLRRPALAVMYQWMALQQRFGL